MSNWHSTQKNLSRRTFLKAGPGFLGLSLGLNCKDRPKTTIADITVDKGIILSTQESINGSFRGSGSQDLSVIEDNLDLIRELWIGRDPLDPELDGEMLWEALYPGRAQLYAEGRDPLTGEVILNKPRRGEQGISWRGMAWRHHKTAGIFMAFSTIDIALWDLRARLLKKPAYQIIGKANRHRVPVYWRPGEADKGLDDARRRARDAFDRGYRYQKWYFTKSAKDGQAGLKENIELVRVLREELPDGYLMFDNHSIRYDDNVDYSVQLCKAVAPYNPFWIEEPICPEHVDGYRRIKEESGVTIAGGEHWTTRYQVQPFLENRCVDYVQSDPVWCGGISEWLRICEMVKRYPDVKVVPHITRPWIAAPHCVASQPEELCPLLEFNYEGGREALEDKMTRSPNGQMQMNMPVEIGIS